MINQKQPEDVDFQRLCRLIYKNCDIHLQLSPRLPFPEQIQNVENPVINKLGL